jgi:hypothetical protein
MEKIEELDGFLCPITHEILKDPVITCDGITYERTAIEEWFQKGKISSPMTGMPLPVTTLTPNVALKKVIGEAYLEISAMVKKVRELEAEICTFQMEKDFKEGTQDRDDGTSLITKQRKLFKNKRKRCEEEIYRIEGTDQAIRSLAERYSSVLDSKQIRLELVEESIQQFISKRVRIETQITRNSGMDAEAEEEEGSCLISEEGAKTKKELRSIKKASKSLKRQKNLLLEEIHRDVSELARCGERRVELQKEKSSQEAVIQSLRELKQTVVSLSELKNSVGFQPDELKAAGYDARDLFVANFTVKELRAGGYQASELKGIPSHLLRQGGYTVKEMREAGYQARQLIQAGYRVREIHRAGGGS